VKKHEITTFVSELPHSLLFCKDNYSTLIDSPTGTGKTELMFQRAKLLEKVIIAFPYTSQVLQQQEKHPNFQYLLDNQNFEPDRGTKIVCTYDKLVSLIKRDLDLNEYELHLDECHNLYLAANYRGNVMYYISNAIRQRSFKKVNLFSSTYEPRYLSNFLIVDEHIKISQKNRKKDVVTCVHIENSDKVTMNEVMINHFTRNVERKEKVLIYRNNKSENVALAQSLEDLGFRPLSIDSDQKNEEEIIQMLKNERIAKDVDVIITTSMLTEGINLLNKSISQIHYIDKDKSADIIRQFTSRARSANHESYIWYKKDENFEVKKDVFEEWYDFTDNAKSLEIALNTLAKNSEEKNHNRIIDQTLNTMSMLHKSWRQYGFRNVNGEVKIDYTRVANYFYELDVTNQSHNSYILGQELEKYEFDVNYTKFYVEINKNDQEQSKENSRVVRNERKLEKISIISDYIKSDVNVNKRLRELLLQRNRTASENREIKIAKEWLALKKRHVDPNDILEIIKNNTVNRAKYRLSLKAQMQNDLLYKYLSKNLKLNHRYDAKERSDVLIAAEQAIENEHHINLNIKKMHTGEIHGKASKGIFENIFNIQKHVLNGKATISITSFDPLFFNTTN